MSISDASLHDEEFFERYLGRRSDIIKDKDADIRDKTKEFRLRYHNFVLRNGRCPTYENLKSFGISLLKTESVLDYLRKEGEITDMGGELVLKGYESVLNPKNRPKRTMPRKDIPERKGNSHNYNADTFFREKKEFIEKNRPGIYELAKHCSIYYPTLKNMLNSLVESGKIRFVKNGKKKEIEVLDGKTAHQTDSQTRKKTTAEIMENIEPEPYERIERILSNTHIKDYLSGLMGTYTSKNAIRIMEGFNQNPLITDEKISESSGIFLNDVRHYLIRFNEKGILSYKIVKDKNTGWRTDYWRIDPKGLKNLKRCCLSDLKEKKGLLESEIEENKNGKYFCGKSNDKHPVLDFESVNIDSKDDDAGRCIRCSEPLIFKTGDELNKPLRIRIKDLESVIEEVSQIEV